MQFKTYLKLDIFQAVKQRKASHFNTQKIIITEKRIHRIHNSRAIKANFTYR